VRIPLFIPQPPLFYFQEESERHKCSFFFPRVSPIFHLSFTWHSVLWATVLCLIPGFAWDEAELLLRSNSRALFPVPMRLLSVSRYTRFSAQQGWRFEVLEIAGSEMGGYKVRLLVEC